MMVNDGLQTCAQLFIPRPAAMPLAKIVFPAPSSPLSRTTSLPLNRRAIALASSNVASSEWVVVSESVGRSCLEPAFFAVGLRFAPCLTSSFFIAELGLLIKIRSGPEETPLPLLHPPLLLTPPAGNESGRPRREPAPRFSQPPGRHP